MRDGQRTDGDRYGLRPFRSDREIVIDAGYLGAGRHVIHGLVEVDVTDACQLLRSLSAHGGTPISFDHDIVDGAPAARFTRALVETIEAAAVLEGAQP